MKQYTIELDETVCKWLEHISEVTGNSVEALIEGGIYHQVTNLEDGAYQAFHVRESE